jgi:hypothetical protein
LRDDGVPTVAVLGAIGPDKGARRLERLVALARDRDVPVRFVLIGYMDTRNTPWQADDARFTVHGRYDRGDLPALLRHYRVALVLYPSAGPETFSYTLSETWAAGLPVLVPPIGALAERVGRTGAGWVMSDAEWRDEALMLERVAALVSPANEAVLRVGSGIAQTMPYTTLDAMADATFAVYEEALAHAGVRPEYPPLERARVRDALGYRPWTPPMTAPTLTPAAPVTEPQNLAARAAHAALAIRHTPLGRVLYRMTPRSVLEALKAQLRT